MKKVFALVSLIVLMLTFTACGKFTCDQCGEEKSGKKHSVELLGEEITICDDCYEINEDIINIFN